MSWFKKAPKVKTPPKHVPRHGSPMTEMLLEQTKIKIKNKELVGEKDNPTRKTNENK